MSTVSAPMTPRKCGRANPLITLMCELEGIQPPSPGAYTAEPSSPLTSEQVGWIKTIIKTQQLSPGNLDNTDEVGGSLESDDVPQEFALVRGQPSTPAIQCGQCNKSFDAAKHLELHMKESHIGTRYFWTGCDARFGREVALKRHLWEHNANAALDQPDPDHRRRCNWPGCSKPFPFREPVTRHLQEHTLEARNTAASSSSSFSL
ncbi:hypothetical protein F5X99DRAFT_429991 [Biscogniauxia marginata]|nr:hypothetical protein F5X99DRAFT_429991 [Biscogniauxia marginata]